MLYVYVSCHNFYTFNNIHFSMPNKVSTGATFIHYDYFHFNIIVVCEADL